MRALVVVTAYLLLSVLWIAFSDATPAGLALAPAQIQTAQTLKGWAFVVVSSVLMVLLLVPYERRGERTRVGLQRSFDLTSAIGSAPDLETALREGLRHALRDSPWALAEVWLYEPSRQDLALASVRPEHPADGGDFVRAGYHTRLRRGEGLAGRVWRDVHSVWIEDVRREDTFCRRDEAAVAGLRTGVGFPFIAADRVVAVLCLYATRVVPRRAALSGLDLLLANQIGAAIATKQAEAAVRRLNDDLEFRVAERTAELSELTRELEAFARTVSHDLKAPLRTISGLAASVDEDIGHELDPSSRSHVTHIRRSAEEMTTLIEDLLAYSQQSRVRLVLEPVDLEAALDETLATLDAFAEASIVVRRPLPSVVGNRAAVRLVLTNVLSNALKFVAPGARAHVRIEAARERDDVRLVIADAGIGMSTADAERVVEPFVRLHAAESYAGTGIGLAAAHRAIIRMGGSLTITSTLGAGTTLTIDLPAFTTSDERTDRMLVGV
ncbi:MAG: GAF domain-containing protein [Trueperaceae bacterium]|nr:GAF domain-containing protein [Trueperaceae bacterium]